LAVLSGDSAFLGGRFGGPKGITMFKRHVSKKAAIVSIAVASVLIASAAGAYVALTGTYSGTQPANVAAGGTAGLTFLPGGVPTLTNGAAPTPVIYVLENHTAGPVTDTGSITINVSTGVPACSSSWFVTTSGSLNNGVIPPGGADTDTVNPATIQFVNLPGVDQSSCDGASLSLAISSP